MGFPDEEMKEDSVNFIDIICEESFREHTIANALKAIFTGYDLNKDEEAMEYIYTLDSYFTRGSTLRSLNQLTCQRSQKQQSLQ